MKFDKPLVMNVVLGGVHDVEQAEEHPEKRFLILMLSPKLKHIHEDSGPQMNLRGGNFQGFLEGYLKFIKRQVHPYLGEQTLIKAN